MNTTDDIVAEAADLIDYDSYVLEPDGSMLPQSSARSIILRMLRLLEIAPGMRVLEVGAGSGYTGALLGRIVGEHGTVISLDVAPGLVTRAARKHSEHGVRNVAVHTTDGFGGWNAGAAYDRIIGWTTPHVLPRSWIEQVRDRAVIVTPVKVAPIADANMILRVDIRAGHPIARDVHVGGYIRDASRGHHRVPGARPLCRRPAPIGRPRRLGQFAGTAEAPGLGRSHCADDRCWSSRSEPTCVWQRVNGRCLPRSPAGPPTNRIGQRRSGRGLGHWRPATRFRCVASEQ